MSLLIMQLRRIEIGIKRILCSTPQIALAFSGGVDSAYLLYAAKQLGAEVRAYYVKTAFQPQFELDDAKRLVEALHADMTVLLVDILSDTRVAANPANRCYFCKKSIFSSILHAASADGFIVINRIKPHPVFVAPYESGLMKMMTIGLGKQKQAEVVHQMGFENFHHLIPLFGNAVLDHANILFGLAIIENAYDQTNRLIALTPEGIRQEEPSLLLDAKAKMPRLLPGYADILVVDKMGKDISGDGMDPNITGRFCQYYTGKPNFTAKRVAVLDLTEATHGNFIGIEAADVTTRRVIDKADPEQTYPNSLTSCGNQHMPMYMKNDREAIQCAIKISTGIDLNDARIIRIPDTLHVTDIMVSENMLPEILQRNDMQVLGEPEEWPFDENGNLW